MCWSCPQYGVSLEGSLPIGTIIETRKEKGVLISDDSANQLHVEDCTSLATPCGHNDPFRLVKSALPVTGIVRESILSSIGLQI